MPIQTQENKFPLLPLPKTNQKWEDWAGNLIQVIEKFFSKNPYSDTFPIGRLDQSEITATGSTPLVIQQITAVSDGRQLMLMSNYYCNVDTTATSGSTWSVKLKRSGSDIASCGGSTIHQYFGLNAFDRPPNGKCVYSLEFSTNSTASIYKMTGRLIWIMDKPNK